MISNSIHLVADTGISFFLMTKQYSIVYLPYCFYLFLHRLASRLISYLCYHEYFCNTLQMSFSYTNMVFLRFIPRSEIAGSHGRYILSFGGILHTASIMAVLICIHTNSLIKFPFLHNFTSRFCVCVFLIITFLIILR